MPEFQDLFQQEIERQISRLQQKNAKEAAALGGQEAGSPNSRRSSHAAAELTHIGELRRLAFDMTKNIFQRLTDNANYWGLAQEEAEEETADAFETGGTETRVQLEAKCQELEAQLRRRLEDETTRKEQLLARFTSKYNYLLMSHEKDILQVRDAATFDAAGHSRANSGSSRVEPCADMQREFSENVERICCRLAEMKEAAIKLDLKKKGMQKMEGMQRRPLQPGEALLAGVMSDFPMETDQDMEEAIRKGEQVCKRMRRHLGA